MTQLDRLIEFHSNEAKLRMSVDKVGHQNANDTSRALGVLRNIFIKAQVVNDAHDVLSEEYGNAWNELGAALAAALAELGGGK